MKLDVFIDANIVYSDPLWLSNFSDLLTNFSKYENANLSINISQIVYEEIKSNFSKITTEKIHQLKKSLNDFERFTGHKVSNELFSLDKYKEKLDSFYEKNFDNGTFNLISYNNSLLPELVNRSINKIKPFSDKKQEFRDAIIWLSMVEYINTNQLENCFFITNNVNDFCNSSKDDIHPELKKECDKLVHYKSIKEFILNEDKLLPIKKRLNFSEWLKQISVDRKYIEKLYHNDYGFINFLILECFDKLRPELYFDDDVFLFEFIEEEDGNNNNKHKILDFKFTPLEDFGLIELSVQTKFSFLMYRKSLFNDTDYFKRGKQVEEYNGLIKLSLMIEKEGEKEAEITSGEAQIVELSKC